MLCCLAVQLQWPGVQVTRIGVTTQDPDSGPVPWWRGEVDSSDQHWYVCFGSSVSLTLDDEQGRPLYRWFLDDSEGNTIGCHVSGTGELHLRYNERDVGVLRKGLPTDQPLWGFMEIDGRWMVEANYVIPKGEAVWCDVVCGVMFVSLYICTC